MYGPKLHALIAAAYAQSVLLNTQANVEAKTDQRQADYTRAEAAAWRVLADDASREINGDARAA